MSLSSAEAQGFFSSGEENPLNNMSAGNSTLCLHSLCTVAFYSKLSNLCGQKEEVLLFELIQAVWKDFIPNLPANIAFIVNSP